MIYPSASAAVIAEDLLAVEFRISSYGAGAAHPNHKTQTFNFLLEPSLELGYLFRPGSKYLGILSQYCLTDLHTHQTPFLKAQRTGETDSWILERGGCKIREL